MNRLFILVLTLIIHHHIIYGQEDFVEKNELISNIALNDSIEKKKKILPFIIPITEPAIGYGLIIGGILFNPKDNPQIQSDMIIAAGGYTTNSTWFAGGGYFGFWKDDSIRYVGYVGGGKITMTFYGLSDIGIGNPFLFDQDIFLFVQKMEFRIGKSFFFLGGKYQLSDISIPYNFKQDNFNNWGDQHYVNSGISIIGEYDNLDDFLSPTKGTKIHLSYDQNLELLGSHKDWGTINFYSHLYLRANDFWAPSLRLEAKVSTGKPPFYALPYVSLRGVPALRYQGKITLVTETEQSFNINHKWGIVGFTGIGAAFKSFDEFKNNELAWNVGAGLRYRPIESMGVKLGADIAKGPEDFAFYISIGSAW